LPSILGPKQLPPSRDVIFSIRPPHAEKILDGTKTVELRRRFTGDVRLGTLALIYTTSPTSALTGFARIQDGLFDVSSGKAPVEQVANRGPDQIDDARESCGVAVTSGPRPGGLEQAVEGLQPGIGMA
jgi:hypothetical protein